jgi:hypothetical protein
MRDAIYQLLAGDATLMAALPGGLHKAAEVGEISRQDTPAAFDANGEIQTCALLRFGPLVPIEPYLHSARQTFALYLYEPKGYQNVDAARERAYVLLQRANVTPATGSSWEIRHTDDVLDGRDSALGCSLEVSRYAAIILRA